MPHTHAHSTPAPSPPSRRWELETLRSRLVEPLAKALPADPNLRLEYLCKPKTVADDATKLLVLNAKCRPIAVVLISSLVEPELVRRGIDRARSIKDQLSPQLGGVILEPLANGTLDTCTYTILPYRKPTSKGRIGKRAHRIILRPIVLRWLDQLARDTARQPDAQALQSGFITPLRHLSDTQPMSPTVQTAAAEAIDRIQTNAWTPRHIVMHGDLWEGNILFANKGTRPANDPYARIVIIDWPGGLIDGYAMYDLIRLARSMHIPRRTLRRHILTHCRSLQCDPRDARAHLLAGLGHLGMNLGHFPPDRYAKMAADCLATIDQVIAD